MRPEKLRLHKEARCDFLPRLKPQVSGRKLMKYPMSNNWLSYHRISNIEYDVRDNLDGSVYTMGCNATKIAKSLDGRTNPYQIDHTLSKEDVESILFDLREYNLLRTSRILEWSLGNLLYTVWIPRRTAFLQIFAFFMNYFLLLLWLPTITFGIYVFIDNVIMIDIGFSVAGCFIGFVLGICLHELGHAFAGIAYHAKVFEVGIGFQCFMPCAYTLMEYFSCKRLHKIQIDAAGIETNILLTGISLMLCAAFPRHGAVFFSIALFNFSLSVFNLLCLNGSDGMTILSNVIGKDVEALLKKAWRVVLSRKSRKRLRQKGIIGHALILTSYIVVILQIVAPLLLVMIICGVTVFFM